ncbi:MAG: hypothetical protein BWY74_01059 [Firmicutes bacterium ADurb.Bin419]|nr:MAG: hypothetical protein BWY74_01059 [Firmicutes bacterium ADurb.Bin419]
MELKSRFYAGSVVVQQPLIISFATFMFMYFLINLSPFGLSRLVEITGGHSILDMEMKGYSAVRAYEVIDALGEEGRAFYIKYIVPLDFPFPLSYGLFWFTTLTLILKSTGIKLKKPWLLGLIGFCATVFDWLENLIIISLLQTYPKRNNTLANIASIFTQLKFLFFIIILLLIIVGMLIIVLKKFLSKAPHRQIK